MTVKTLLIGDIGGTNARFAVAFDTPDDVGYRDELTVQCADFAGVDQAIRFYIDETGVPAPAAICLAIAGPVENQQAQLTNNSWFISAQDLSRQFSDCPVQLINDFTAIALSIPVLGSRDLSAVETGKSYHPLGENFTAGVLGPGTGLGIAGLIRQQGQTIPVTSEAGHMGFAPDTERQIELLHILHQRWPRVSNERLVSGAGLENIYWALNRIERNTEASRSAAEIFTRAQDNQRSLAFEAVQIFFEVLGQVAGDIALAYGAYDGIYIAGGMVKRYPDLLRSSRFRQAFENKGRHRPIIETVPTSLITHPQPGLLGCAAVARNSP